jgi:hypothetical protein
MKTGGDASFLSVQEQEAHYVYLGDYERQVASTIKLRVKGDGRMYGFYLKTDSYFEGVGINELWQAHLKTRCVAVWLPACAVTHHTYHSRLRRCC